MERFYVTQKGLEYFSKTATGSRLIFTKGKFGDGVLSGNVNELTDLINPLGEMPITKEETTGANVTIQTQFSNRVNGSILNTFYLNEIGLFAKLQNADGSDDENYSETLVCYAYETGETAGDKISGVLTEFLINFPCTISNTENVEICVDSMAYVTKSVVVDYVIKADSWTENQCVFSHNSIKENSIIELVPQQGITEEQLTALQTSNIVGINQSAGGTGLLAYGEVPTIDIPVTFIIRGDV